MCVAAHRCHPVRLPVIYGVHDLTGWGGKHLDGVSTRTNTHVFAQMYTIPRNHRLKTSVFTMDGSQPFKLDWDKMNWANNAKRSFLALPCGDCEPFLEDWKWKCFVWLYASGVLCQDAWLFGLLRDCHCENYKSACLRLVLHLKSPGMTKHRCRKCIIFIPAITRWM